MDNKPLTTYDKQCIDDVAEAPYETLEVVVDVDCLDKKVAQQKISFFINDENGKPIEKLAIWPDRFEVDGRPVALGDVEKHDQQVYQAFVAFVEGSLG